MIKYRRFPSKEDIILIVRKYKWNIITILIFSLFSIYIGPDHAVAFRYDVLRFVCSMVLVFSFFCFARAIGKMGWILVVPVFVLLSLQLGYRFTFLERVPKSVLAAIVETNWQEAQGVLGHYLKMLAAAVAFFLVCVFCFFKFEKIKNKLINLYCFCSCILLFAVPILWNVIESDRFLPDAAIDPQVVGGVYYDINNLVFGDVVYLASTVMLDGIYRKNTGKKCLLIF